MIHYPIMQVGLGGIGSWVPPHIVAKGCEVLYLLDPDVVEMHNFTNQNYTYPDDLGMPKVDAITRRCRSMILWHEQFDRSMRVFPRQIRADEKTEFSGIVIVAVDSAPARKKIFSACKYNPAVNFYIEAGAAENLGRVRCLIPHHKDHVVLYEKLLQAMLDLEDGGPPPCVSPYMGGQFASLIASYISKFAEERWRPETIYQSEINYIGDPFVETNPIY